MKKSSNRITFVIQSVSLLLSLISVFQLGVSLIAYQAYRRIEFDYVSAQAENSDVSSMSLEEFEEHIHQVFSNRSWSDKLVSGNLDRSTSTMLVVSIVGWFLISVLDMRVRYKRWKKNRHAKKQNNVNK